MYISKIKIKNYRLLIDAELEVDAKTTLIVGRNNTAKTSCLACIENVLNGHPFSFDDYPLVKRKTLYEIIASFMSKEISFESLCEQLEPISIEFLVDYSLEDLEDNLGALSPFIIDVDVDTTTALIRVEFRLKPDEKVLWRTLEKSYYPNGVFVPSDEARDVISTNFSKLFELVIYAVNPKNPKETQIMNNKKGKIVNRIINGLLVLGCLTVLFPLYMTVIIAFKQPSEMTNDVAGALAFPSSWNFDNFREAMEVTDFWNSLGNSVLITGGTVVLCILIHSFAGYVIGRKMAEKKAFKAAYFYVVSGMFVPFAVLMMPLVKQTAQMGIANRFGVIVLYLVFFMPMNIMLYTGYLKNIPTALEEAANIDGATAWQTFWKIIFPNMKPMHATVAILTAMSTWNDVTTPLVILSGTGQNTLPMAQLNFQSQFGTNYNLAFASYLLALLPILIFYIICQKQILNGVANGAVK